MQPLNDLWFGISKNKAKTAKYIFVCFSSLFTVVKIITQFFPGVDISGVTPLVAGLTISVGWGLWRVWKPSRTSFRVSHSNVTIEILFGDIFTQDGIRAIGVTEFFETELGKPVSEKSLHGLFLRRHFSGYRESIDAQLATQLAEHEVTEVSDKPCGKTQCYPIGTTALVTVNEEQYILFALCKTVHETCKAYSDVELMWRALHRLWQRARAECNGYPLNLPLVGSGLSGLNLPTRDLLNLLILSAITESKANEITQTIRIVLQKIRFEDIDLREVKQHWEP